MRMALCVVMMVVVVMMVMVMVTMIAAVAAEPSACPGPSALTPHERLSKKMFSASEF